MANFKIPENGKNISKFYIPQGRKVQLLQWGGDMSGNQLRLSCFARGADGDAFDFDVLGSKQPAASTAFTVMAKRQGAKCSISANIRSTGSSYSNDLEIEATGKPKRHDGYTVDFLHDLAASGNAKDIDVYNDIVTGTITSENKIKEGHRLSQNTTAGKYNCGDTAASYGTKIFSKPTYTNYFTYYNPPVSDKMDDLAFDPKRMSMAISKIKGHLNAGTPVRVWLIHHDGFKKKIEGDTRTHFLTIIGYSDNRFLTIDPWPGGSMMLYDGGVWPAQWNGYLGELTYDAAHLEKGIHNRTLKKGAHDYIVIAGP